MRESIEVGIE